MHKLSLSSPTAPTSLSNHDCDVGNENEMHLTKYWSVSVDEQDGKNVEQQRLQSRAAHPDKQSQTRTEEIAEKRLAYPGNVDEGCNAGFWKDSIMRDALPAEGNAGLAYLPQHRLKGPRRKEI